MSRGVNYITPGFSPASKDRHLLFKEDGAAAARGQVILGHTPMARFGTPIELVGLQDLTDQADDNEVDCHDKVEPRANR